jgi:exodeoxyribonuclease VII large subunit
VALETSAESPAAVRTVSRLLADWIGRLGGIWVDGQVAEFRRRPGARNLYLVLRDPDVDMSITVVADVSVIGAVEPPLAEGQRIIVFGKPEFWTGRGTLSLRAKEIRAVGLGELLAQLARLRELLTAEGLFANDRKKPLPFLPRRVGLICGRNSAAMHDVLVNARERWPSIQFVVREVAVQGVQAVSAVGEALAELDALPDVDVIVIARGGGSVEDLLPFSNETLVRAVSACTTPVVSAIGHEQDAPLIDFVADLRASTPTDAAKRIVPSLAEQTALVTSLRARSHRVVVGQLDRETQRITDLRRRSRAVVLNAIASRESEIGHLSARVRTLSPAATLERGYAIVTNASGVIVRSPDDADSALDIRVTGGRFTATRTDN